MKFSAGYQPNEAFKKTLLCLRPSVSEIYFPWLNFASGRGAPTSITEQIKMEADLADFAAAGFNMNLLLNGNCYGRNSQSRAFFRSIGDTAESLKSRFNLSSVTTASPLIAKFLKANFADIEVRASVNMEIGTKEGIEYIEENFDGFYLKREFNRDIARIQSVREYCAKRGKKFYILANSGCLNFCSARNFHDNLVAHQHEISEMDNAYEFKGACHEFLSCADARKTLLRRSNFIRPEDVRLYENLCDAMKLATRTSRNPSAVVGAYCGGKFSGNLLDLTEPSHSGSFYPSIVANDRIPEDFGERRLKCGGRCETCEWCDSAQRAATVILEQTGELKQC